MKNILTTLLLMVGLLHAQTYSIVLHGGAGNGIRPEKIDPEKQAAYRTVMAAALEAGAAVLDSGGTAADAVVAVIEVMENSPLFNAGRGAVFTWEERNEMDASIMRGDNLNAGAVAGVSTIKNPIKAALAVMEHSPHIMLSGDGALQFAISQGLMLADSSYFGTERRREYLRRYKNQQGARLPQSWEEAKMGTVGCVVLDKKGNLAAGTSTGGMTGKRYGRIGDSPIIGAGTYANNSSCAISCTGHGEYFIRYAVAYDMHARMFYQGMSGDEAARHIIHDVLAPAGGDGGLIGLSAEGEIIMDFNTDGMFRASLREGEKAQLLMFAN